MLFRNILGFFATSLSISIAAATKIKHLVSIKAPTSTPENYILEHSSWGKLEMTVLESTYERQTYWIPEHAIFGSVQTPYSLLCCEVSAGYSWKLFDKVDKASLIIDKLTL